MGEKSRSTNQKYLASVQDDEGYLVNLMDHGIVVFKLQLPLQRGLPSENHYESGFDREESFFVGEKELDNDDVEPYVHRAT